MTLGYGLDNQIQWKYTLLLVSNHPYNATMTDVQGLLAQSTRSLQTTSVRDMTTEENLPLPNHTKHQHSDVQQNH